MERVIQTRDIPGVSELSREASGNLGTLPWALETPTAEKHFAQWRSQKEGGSPDGWKG
jgi:hypothetical protein